MISRLLSIALLILLPLSSLAQQGDGDAQGVIEQQLEAFADGDLEGAFGFASPGIKSIFQTPERFGQMVRDGHPMVWRPSSVRFGSSRSESGRVYQTVIFRVGGGQYHALEYQMIAVGGAWKINGVRFVEVPDVGA